MLLIFIAVFAWGSCVRAADVSDDVDPAKSSSIVALLSFRPSHFTQPLYKATIVEGNQISFMDGPVILENANNGMYFVITSYNYEDYSIIPTESNSTDEKQIQLELLSTTPLHKEFDVIALEALDKDLMPVSRTTILLFNSHMEFDMYKMTFKVDDEEYIILNFYYFKWFLGMLSVTGIAILLIELHEIARNIRIARKHGKYNELLNI